MGKVIPFEKGPARKVDESGISDFSDTGNVSGGSRVLHFPQPRRLKPESEEKVSEMVEKGVRVTQDFQIEWSLEMDDVLVIKEFLTSLAGRPSKNSTDTALSTLKDVKLEELEEIAKKSNKSQWQKHPGYFTVLVDLITAKS